LGDQFLLLIDLIGLVIGIIYNIYWMVKMKRNYNRRDFLKLASLLPLGLAAPRFMNNLTSQSTKKQNVLIIVFDALSALNISFYGYGRETTPNLARLAERAVVYHNHYAGGNFTTPGTATLLTGTLPWTHRAFQPNAQVSDAVASHNLFNAFKDYYRISYTQNGWAYTLLKQFQSYINEVIPWGQFSLESHDKFIHSLFVNDDDIATVAWVRNIKIEEEGYSYSLFLSHLYQALRRIQTENHKAQFPRGIPTTGSDNGFLLETATDWLGRHLAASPQPFLGYFHFLPPHYPYRTSAEFYDRFAYDNLQYTEKKLDVFTYGKISNGLPRKRREYDEFILYADKAFGDLYASMEEAGLIENTWIVFTSDHGEIFERGISGHSTPVMYQPLVRIPMILFEPGRTEGMNISVPTSAGDVLPTLLHVTSQQIPDWVEGMTLPPYATTSQPPERSIYSLRAKDNDPDAPLTQASVMLVKGRYKLTSYFGYTETQGLERMELYDVESDPEEMNNLYAVETKVAKELLDELKAKLAEVNEPYLK
jgi:choline-sulfatase